MATISGTVTAATYVDLTTTHTLSGGQAYVITNAGDSDMELREVASLPAVTDLGHIVKPDETWSFTQDAVLELYVVARGGTTTYIITEAS